MTDSSVTIHAETSSELLEFLELTEEEGSFELDNAFVEKRGSDEYYRFDLEREGSHETSRLGPKNIIELTDWCSPDIIISRDEEPILTVETTYHELTHNNIAQRIPRQVKSARKGVPSIIFQKQAKDETEDYLNWYAQSFLKAMKAHGTTCLPILFNDETHDSKSKQLTRICNEYINNGESQTISDIRDEAEQIAEGYDPDTVLKTKNGNSRSWIRDFDDEVVCIVGANPDAQGWRTKGTGNMDPYPGLAKMCELLFCYDDSGNRTKRLTTYFRNLPRDFWWFQENENSLYYRIIKEFSEEVYYKGEYEV